jgi:hypothetical protein
MKQSPSWEANRQEIPQVVWDPKIHYRVHRSPQLVPILSQMNPVTPPYFYKINSNINVPI